MVYVLPMVVRNTSLGSLTLKMLPENSRLTGAAWAGRVLPRMPATASHAALRKLRVLVLMGGSVPFEFDGANLRARNASTAGAPMAMPRTVRSSRPNQSSGDVCVDDGGTTLLQHGAQGALQRGLHVGDAAHDFRMRTAGRGRDAAVVRWLREIDVDRRRLRGQAIRMHAEHRLARCAPAAIVQHHVQERRLVGA